MIQHHGDSILRLAGVRDVVSWKALQSEVVQPHQLPDGLLEVQVAGQPDRDWFILELATFPEPRLVEQILRDLALVYLDRGTLPEVVALVLHPRGTFRVSGALDLRSRHGLTHWQVGWRVVELWTVPAADLLAAQDVGLVPWVPLASFAEPPEKVFEVCRERIDKQAPANERQQLLAVTSVLASLRYNDLQLLAIFGGKQVMLEFPVIQELVAERLQNAIVRFLRARFGEVPEDIVTALQAVHEEPKLYDLVDFAGTCSSLEAFRVKLHT